MDPLAEALELLRAAYVQHPFTDMSARVYAQQLSDLDPRMVLSATRRLLNTSVYRPTIADIRREVAEEALGLPSAEEAWDMAVAGNSQGNEVVRASLKACGGPWMIRNSTSPETLRAQFRKDYEGRRAAFVKKAAVGAPLTPEILKAAREPVTNGTPDNVSSLNGRRLLALPESERIHPRPVMWRLAQRYAGRIVPPPDEAMRQDAIEILRGDRQGTDDVLYAEAEKVLHDACEIRG